MNNKDKRKELAPGAERRYLEPEIKKEVREQDDGKLTETIRGYAALYNVRTSLGWFDEMIAPGAFDDVLDDDVRVLINHDPSQIVGRCNNGKGSARIFTDDTGLGFELEIPDTTIGRDLLRNIELGNITQCSFGFTVKSESWENGEGNSPDLRTITKVERLYDVSPVTFPAYPDTTIAKRSHAEAFKADPPVETGKKGLYIARFKYLQLINK